MRGLSIIYMISKGAGPAKWARKNNVLVAKAEFGSGAMGDVGGRECL